MFSRLFACCFVFPTPELVIPATGNVFYAMKSSSVDFLLRQKDGHTPLSSQPISNETSATFPRIKAKGRRLVRTLFWAPQQWQTWSNPTGTPPSPPPKTFCCWKCSLNSKSRAFVASSWEEEQLKPFSDWFCGAPTLEESSYSCVPDAVWYVQTKKHRQQHIQLYCDTIAWEVSMKIEKRPAAASRFGEAELQMTYREARR